MDVQQHDDGTTDETDRTQKIRQRLYEFFTDPTIVRIGVYHHRFYGAERGTAAYRAFLRECAANADTGGDEILYGSDVGRAAGGAPYMRTSSAIGLAIVDRDFGLLEYLVRDVGADVQRPIHVRNCTEGCGRLLPFEFALFLVDAPSARILVALGARLTEAALACIMRLCAAHWHISFRAILREYLNAIQPAYANILSADASLRAIPLEVVGMIAEYATVKLPPLCTDIRCPRCPPDADVFSCFMSRFQNVHQPVSSADHKDANG